MTAPPNEFEPFLTDDESVVDGVSGTLVDGSRRFEGSIGVTDRRVLFLSDGERFVDVSHDAIHSIRSRPRTTYTYRGMSYRLMVVLGGLVATVAFLGVIVVKSSALALVLTFLTVVGSAGAEFVRRHGIDVEGTPLEDVGDHHYTPDHSGLLGQYLTRTKYDGDREPLVLGIVSAALVALIGLVALTETLFVIPLVFVTLGGIALVDVAHRRKRNLDAIGGSRRHEREVNLHLASGRSVHLRFEADERIDRELSGVARRTERTYADVEVVRSQP